MLIADTGVAETPDVEVADELVVSVIADVPAATPVTTPLELMVAILEFVIVHVPPAVVEVAVMVPPTQSVVAPVIVLAVGAAYIVMLRVAVALQPPVATKEYVIVTVPAVRAVTTPVVLIVATVVSLLLQVPPAIVSV